VRPSLETLEDRLVPSTMAGAYPDGVWRYDMTAGWNHISTRQATQLDVDDAGDVYGAFSDGLWRWSAATASWSHPSSLTVNQFAVTASGILYGDFKGSGLWRWDPSTAGWAHLSNLHPTAIAVSDSDAFFGSFSTGSVGIWRWTPTAGWSLLTANQSGNIFTDTTGDFVGVFSAPVPTAQQGTWRWNPTAGWAHLSSVPTTVVVSANGTIFEERFSKGLWRAAPGVTSFTQLDAISDDSSSSLAALPDGSLFADRSVTGDIRYTGWYWNSSEPGFGVFKFLPNSDGLIEEGIGKDGDLFFFDNGGASGTGYWSPQSTYHSLGGLNTQLPFFLASQR
jgi:hypothetical protein